MGRNKDIELLHEFTGKPYKECRELLKKKSWDLPAVFCDPQTFVYKQTFEDLRKAINDGMEATAQALSSVDEIARSLREDIMDPMKSANFQLFKS